LALILSSGLAVAVIVGAGTVAGAFGVSEAAGEVEMPAAFSVAATIVAATSLGSAEGAV
jgi:hypothetical protein